MKLKKYLILVFCAILTCAGCSSEKNDNSITSVSSHGAGAVAYYEQTPVVLLNGMLYNLNEDACGLELFCDIENCAHQFSSVLTEPSQCPAALGNGYIIGSFENELYAAVNAAGWNLYQYSAEEKCFKPLNHILEIVDFEGAFYQNYFYYFSEGSLKRVALEQNAESEYVFENMAGSKEYRLGEMAFFDDHLIMSGSLTTIDAWIYNVNEGEIAKADIELKTESAEYCAGKLYYISPENILYSYTPENGNTEALVEFAEGLMNIYIAVDEDYIYATLLEDIQNDGTAAVSSLEIYTHDGQLVNEISLDPIENDMMKTVMCSNSKYIYLGSSYAQFDQSLYAIEKDALKEGNEIELVPVS